MRSSSGRRASTRPGRSTGTRPTRFGSRQCRARPGRGVLRRGAGPSTARPTSARSGAGTLGVFSALVLALFASGADFDWEFVLFAIPVGLLALAGLLGYRAFRNPDRRR
ncbi:MAG TPA: hypothetical protein VHK22_06340 [Gaiellaceae bacterium]|nr:hypothetical protein [Gaiellaceae bacterium]